MIYVSFRIGDRLITFYFNPIATFIIVFVLNITIISGFQRLILYRRSRIKRKLDIETTLNVWNKRGGNADILACIADPQAIYEITNPSLLLFIKQFLARYGLTKHFRNNVTVISRELFLYAIVKYNSSIQPILMDGFGLQISSIFKVSFVIFSSLLVSSLVMWKYKILIKKVTPRGIAFALLFAFVTGTGLSICTPDCSAFCYSKQTDQHHQVTLLAETATQKIVTLYDDPSLIKHKIFVSDLPREEIKFMLLKDPEPLIKNRIFTKIKKKTPLSHRTQTIDMMNKKELKKLANRDFCQTLPKYEKEKIKAERIKND